ncbi:unnamed protein product [Haemonchus placei]|uniref:Calponin-homology (CH) domain-containing protein n=1 Tax=Haemonchus placei TaxID=6290 RepID=A0A0N4WWE2_HAEPC|nr:unnamed protein product [Haemonchus placei]
MQNFIAGESYKKGFIMLLPGKIERKLKLVIPDEDERAQKNTFTRWINLHLEEHSSSGRVNDLFEDIKDGVLLCHLIEVLTGEALVSKCFNFF